MRETHVARRYAQALFNVARSKDAIDIIASELSQLKSLAENDSRFLNFLEAPQVLTEHKNEMIKSLFTTRLSPALLSFLMLLVAKGRINLLGDIAREFEKLLEEFRGIVKAKVITAVHLDEDFRSRLKDKLERLCRKKVDIIHRIDKAIIGGIVVYLNNRVIDYSVRYQLDILKHDLMAARVY